jgi:hypothetical protein
MPVCALFQQQVCSRHGRQRVSCRVFFLQLVLGGAEESLCMLLQHPNAIKTLLQSTINVHCFAGASGVVCFAAATHRSWLWL